MSDRNEHADAVWVDIRTADNGGGDGRAPLRKHHERVNGKVAWRFPYAGRAYLLYRLPADKGLPAFPATSETMWAIREHVEPGVVRLASARTGMLADGRTMKSAVRSLVGNLYGTDCPHGYVIGQDSCPGCDGFASDDWR